MTEFARWLFGRWGAWRGPWSRPRPNRPLPAVVWLGFILFPVVDAVTSGGSPLTRALVIAGAVVFSGGYVAIVVILFRPGLDPARWALVAVLLAIAVALTLHAGSNWGFLFIYCGVCLALVVPRGHEFRAVAACTALCVACSAAGGANAGSIVSFATSAIGIGLLMVVMRDLRERNAELCQARAELARTAVAQERERFARDLHDLLGHSLSVIAIKAELVRRLMVHEPERAAVEVVDVEQVARQALGEVRQAVSDYRRPTLDGELAGARMALSAAGIEAEIERAPVELAPEVEAVLAWAVREGATNVIRHSGARRCTVRVQAGLVDAAVEVVDDGGGAGAGAGAGPRAGNGLAGLTERARGLRGRLEADALPGGGFRLNVSVPVGGW